MRLDDCYRLLDLEPGASVEEAKRAHRELTKVWHPDRFGHDAALRQRAEEKLKSLNEAWETIREAGEGGARREESVSSARSGGTAALRGDWTWVFACTFLGLFLLLRRPTPAGLLLGLALLFLAWTFVLRTRR